MPEFFKIPLGLTIDEVSKNRKQHGSYKRVRKAKYFPFILFNSFFSLFNLILYGLILILFVFGEFSNITVIFLLNVSYSIILLIQKSKFYKSIENSENKSHLQQNVLRQIGQRNQLNSIKISQIVVGDVIYLEGESEVIFNGEIIAQDYALFNESIVNGRSDLIDKNISYKINKVIKHQERKKKKDTLTHKIHIYYNKYIKPHKYIIIILIIAAICLYFRYKSIQAANNIDTVINSLSRDNIIKKNIETKLNSLKKTAPALKSCGHTIDYPCICNQASLIPSPQMSENINDYLSQAQTQDSYNYDFYKIDNENNNNDTLKFDSQFFSTSWQPNAQNTATVHTELPYLR